MVILKGKKWLRLRFQLKDGTFIPRFNMLLNSIFNLLKADKIFMDFTMALGFTLLGHLLYSDNSLHNNPP